MAEDEKHDGDGPVVELRDVVKSYPSSAGPVTVLRGVDLAVAAGSTVVVKGVSGSGKSTLLHLIGAVDSPTSGQVTICGQDVGELSRRGQADLRARRIGFVFQFFNLMPMLTAAENVASGLEPLKISRRRRADAALHALEVVGLRDQVDKYPAQLSGGQQQRVAIARAMAKRPPLILADEPTGALDSVTAHQVLECLKTLQAETGCALVVATHDPLVCEHADRILRIVGGGIEQES